MNNINAIHLWSVKAFALTLACLFSSACSNSFEQDIKASIQANNDSKNIMEWEASEYNSSSVFAKWNNVAEMSEDTQEVQNNICNTLLNTDVTSLTIFESEFEDAQTKALIKPCLTALQTKLDNFYQAEAKSLQQNISTKNFNRSRAYFRPIIKDRDFSKGYHTQHADLARKEVILTFDDGPHRTLTPQILNSLNAANAKVLFFPVGRNVKALPNILKQTAQSGHFIGSHTYNHPCLGPASQCNGLNKGRAYDLAAAKREISMGHQAVIDVLGWVQPFFRFPYGAATNSARQYLKDNSIADFAWNIDSNDWKQQTTANLLRNTLRQIDQQGRGIVLFHDIQRRTAEVMPSFLDELYNRGFNVVLIAPAGSSSQVAGLQ